MGIKNKHVKSREKTKIRSMTGFGRASVKSIFGTVCVEIKTLNNKSLSINCLPFEGFFLLEERLNSIIDKHVSRGKVFIRITRENTSKGGKKFLGALVSINTAIAKQYLVDIASLKKSLGIKSEITIQDILRLPHVIEEKNTSSHEEEMWPYIEKATIKALKELIKFREVEGARLAQDFLERLIKIEKIVATIKEYEKKSIEYYRTRLIDKIRAVTGKQEVDMNRLEEEVGVFARNYDIAEEIIRLEHHIKVYDLALCENSSDAGKKLDFIAQEMHREVNTIGSKSSDYRISNGVIELKSEIERIREQVKNIE
ncbi:hypothetical protein OMAG_001569 [Candidatus Omnitrophus magneticus]|uniref:YicC family protein n=1 Tax=Candidatus Omnitrophus magneticus TaxID=1609969 RepID=A0A0F0CRC7_9BACT|nr:hypothetical protein OMAG_001569 [Candidatus Omnitrophus magneticus]